MPGAVDFLGSPDSSGSRRLSAAMLSEVVGPRWLAQTERPSRLTDVDFASLPVELRLLLIHDGTLTTALEAYQLAPITADVIGQDDVLLEPEYAGWLHAAPGTPAVRRSTMLRHRITGRLLVQCEVHLLVERLPAGFLEVLASCDKGLGAAFGQLRIETRRELLWYGRSPMVGLSDPDRLTSGGSGVSRGYRLILGSTPICCIEEIFPDAVIRDSSEG
ncbi:MAG TPA: chorismate pyruvate-lyase family protein [Kineosporiaceae bacterium]|nr:chorismate pyruvate-lyase family protein [Kineosporiaceae bacterium]